MSKFKKGKLKTLSFQLMFGRSCLDVCQKQGEGNASTSKKDMISRDLFSLRSHISTSSPLTATPPALKRRRLSKDDKSDNQLASSASSSKPLCQYGRNCYRKNLEHFRQFDHPEGSVSHPRDAVGANNAATQSSKLASQLPPAFSTPASSQPATSRPSPSRIDEKGRTIVSISSISQATTPTSESSSPSLHKAVQRSPVDASSSTGAHTQEFTTLLDDAKDNEELDSSHWSAITSRVNHSMLWFEDTFLAVDFIVF